MSAWTRRYKNCKAGKNIFRESHKLQWPMKCRRIWSQSWKADTWMDKILFPLKQIVNQVPYILDKSRTREYMYRYRHFLQRIITKIMKLWSVLDVLEKWLKFKPNHACICGKGLQFGHSWRHCRQWDRPKSVPPLQQSEWYWLFSIRFSGLPTDQLCRSCNCSRVGSGHCSTRSSLGPLLGSLGLATVLGSHN